jgi:hypothetical protein
MMWRWGFEEVEKDIDRPHLGTKIVPIEKGTGEFVDWVCEYCDGERFDSKTMSVDDWCNECEGLGHGRYEKKAPCGYCGLAGKPEGA